jgi:hypothetical protein
MAALDLHKEDCAYLFLEAKPLMQLVAEDRRCPNEAAITFGNRIKMRIIACLLDAYRDREFRVAECWNACNPQYAVEGRPDTVLLWDSRDAKALNKACRDKDAIEVCGRGIRIRFETGGDNAFLDITILERPTDGADLDRALAPALELINQIKQFWGIMT